MSGFLFVLIFFVVLFVVGFITVFIWALVDLDKKEKKKAEEKARIEAQLTDTESTVEYNPDRTISGIISADYTLRKWRIESFPNCKLIDFDKIAGFELVEDGKITFNSSSSSTNGLSRALLGGFVAGDTGAIVGAVTGDTRTRTTVNQTVTSRAIRISLLIPEVPQFMLELPTVDTTVFGEPIEVAKVITKAGVLYEVDSKKAALEAIGLLESITKYEEAQKAKALTEDDDVVLLRKYKSMFEEGLITEEEYAAKKKEILNI